MKTIIKGKNMINKYEYDFSDCYVSYLNPFGDNKYIQYLCRELNHHRSTKIKTIPEFVSYETYFESDNILYRLHIGEEFEGNIIEKVEGKDNGDVVYYTDKILNIDLNESSKSKFKSNLDEMIQNIEEQVREEYDKKNEKKWYQFWK